MNNTSTHNSFAIYVCKQNWYVKESFQVKWVWSLSWNQRVEYIDISVENKCQDLRSLLTYHLHYSTLFLYLCKIPQVENDISRQNAK